MREWLVRDDHKKYIPDLQLKMDAANNMFDA
jgi:hypothetical protein